MVSSRGRTLSRGSPIQRVYPPPLGGDSFIVRRDFQSRLRAYHRLSFVRYPTCTNAGSFAVTLLYDGHYRLLFAVVAANERLATNTGGWNGDEQE